MIPVSDDNSLRKSTPAATYALILINIAVFFMELAGGEPFILKWSFTPSHFLEHPGAEFPTLFTSMFMHAGWGHLIGNMLYLWIFGDNVEDRLGKIPYIIFYILSGLGADFLQLFFNPGSSVPNLGASGAIAGVLGAYILFFPSGRVNVLVGRSMTQMSSWIVIGIWFLLQFFSGVAASTGSQDTGGIAYMAHIGGFLAGLAMAFIFRLFLR
jgi:membrane associated rhomboid family serine protease